MKEKKSLKKKNYSFYLREHTHNQLDLIKKKYNLLSNDEVLTFLIERFLEQDESVETKLKFIEQEIQIQTYLVEQLCNHSKINLVPRSNLIFDYYTIVQSEIEKKIRIKQLNKIRGR